MYVSRMSFSIKFILISVVVLFSMIIIMSCAELPSNPDNPSNTAVSLLLKSSTGVSGPEMVIDSVGKSVEIMALLRYPEHVNFVKFDVFDEKGTLDSTCTFAASKNVSFDTVDFVYKPLSGGNKLVIATASISNGNILKDSAVITVFAPVQNQDKPEVPTLSTDTSNSSSTAKLSWSASSKAMYYAVYRSATENGDYLLCKDSITALSYVDSTEGKIWFYYVVAKNNTGASSPSGIVSSDKKQNLPPKWKNDSIDVSLASGKVYNLTLGDTCSDPDGDTLQYAIIGTSSGAILNGVYSYTSARTDSGVIVEKITAFDIKGLCDTMFLRITITKSDVIPPVMALMDPVRDSTSVSSASYTLLVKCTDISGLKTVNCVLRDESISVVKINDTIYSAAISGIPSGGYAAAVFTATDNSEAQNNAILTVHMKYDPTLTDTTAPRIMLVNPQTNGQHLVNDSITVLFKCYDESSIASISCSRAETALSVTGGTDSLYSVKINGLQSDKHDTVKIIATDKSVNANKMTFSVLLNHVSTFTVSYNVNGEYSGNVPVDEKRYETGDSVIVKDQGTIAKNGFAFAGWSLSADGSGTVYAPEEKIVIAATDIKLFAKWSVNTYKIIYNLDGGTNAVSNPSNYTISSGLITFANPSKAGFRFAGWFADAGFTTAVASIPAGSTGDIALFAKWTPVYTVTYNGNGSTNGTVPVDVGEYISGDFVTVLENSENLVRTGYTYDGWYTNANGTAGTLRTPGSTFAIGSANVVLYAKWLPKTYVVTFNGQGAEADPNPLTKNVTSPATKVDALPSPPTKNGYIFAGWWTSANGYGTQFTANTLVSADDTVFAKWEIRDVDGNLYHEVKIGTQVWMVENLKVTRYTDGTSIVNDTSLNGWGTIFNTPDSAKYCWYNNDSVSNKPLYGALYNWYTFNPSNSKKLAPAGWHVPDDNDWNTLITYLGGDSVAGGKLKETGTAHWEESNTCATNETGFTGLPGGYCFPNNGIDNRTFYNQGHIGSWWSTSAWNYYLYSGNCYISKEIDYKRCGYSVRLLRD